MLLARLDSIRVNDSAIGAIPTLATDAETVTLRFAEVVQAQDAPTTMANARIKISLLSDLNCKVRIFLDDLPIDSAEGKPPIIHAERDLHRIADGIDDIDPIALMVWLLNVDANPDFILEYANPAQRLFGGDYDFISVRIGHLPPIEMPATLAQTEYGIF